MKEEILIGVLPHKELGYHSTLEVRLINEKDERGFAKSPKVVFSAPGQSEEYEAGGFLFEDGPFLVVDRGYTGGVIWRIEDVDRRALAARMKQFIRPDGGSFRVQWVASDPASPF